MTDQIPSLNRLSIALLDVNDSLKAGRIAFAEGFEQLGNQIVKIKNRQKLNLILAISAVALFFLVLIIGIFLLASLNSGNQFLQSCFKADGKCYKQSLKAQKDPNLLMIQATINVCYAHSATPKEAVLCIQRGLAALPQAQTPPKR
jgi:hypothetical protein